jgi:hypothetical protein
VGLVLDRYNVTIRQDSAIWNIRSVNNKLHRLTGIPHHKRVIRIALDARQSRATREARGHVAASEFDMNNHSFIFCFSLLSKRMLEGFFTLVIPTPIVS